MPTTQSNAQDIVKALADWSKKYPRTMIHSASNQKQMDDELIAIEEMAKDHLTTQPQVYVANTMGAEEVLRDKIKCCGDSTKEQRARKGAYVDALMIVKEYANRPVKGDVERPTNFKIELEGLINKYSMENASNTPDFILAEYLIDSLNAFNDAEIKRSKWYSKTESDEKI